MAMALMVMVVRPIVPLSLDGFVWKTTHFYPRATQSLATSRQQQLRLLVSIAHLHLCAASKISCALTARANYHSFRFRSESSI
jgi:hypothetical protein